MEDILIYPEIPSAETIFLISGNKDLFLSLKLETILLKEIKNQIKIKNLEVQRIWANKKSIKDMTSYAS
jgi:hypothetical protein